MTRLRGQFPLVLLTTFGTLLGLVVIEAVARVAAIREERLQGRLERDLSRLSGPSPRSTASLGQIIRKSSNPRIVYELRPRLDVTFAGARLTTSDSGYRGLDVSTPKPAEVFRVVGIGDSYMFGQGVADDETYLARLAGPTVELLSGRPVETVNLAVPGFNTVMEVETLRARGEALQPDLVIIEIVGNDLDLPNFLWNTVDPWSLRRLFVLDFVRGRLVGPGPVEASAGDLSEAPRGEGGVVGSFSRAEDRVPARYRSMVGLAAFGQALRELAEFGRTRRIPVVALSHGVWFEHEMLAALKANSIPALVLRPALRLRARRLGAPDYPRSPLALSATDLHPSPLGHRAIAEELAAWLKTTLGSTGI